MFTVGNASAVLREVQLPIVSQSQCKNDYKLFGGITVDDTVLCAGYRDGGKDACMVSYSRLINLMKC